MLFFTDLPAYQFEVLIEVVGLFAGTSAATVDELFNQKSRKKI
jgi:hypothetical protein